MSIYTVLLYLLEYVVLTNWHIYSVFIIIGISGYFLYKPVITNTKATNVELVIVTIGSKGIKNALLECIEHTSKMFNCPLHILIDEGCDLYDELVTKNIPITVVPKEYRLDLIAKGRAMNYFIETVVKPTNWYGFIDDDNLVLDDKFLYEIPYYEAKGYVAMNPSLIPRRGKSEVAYIMDIIRYFDDIFIFRTFTGLLKKPLIGLHGELMCARGDILKKIGYGEKSIVEDFKFASKLVKYNLKTWQSSTNLSIKSPNTVKDLIKQRNRWINGIIEDSSKCPFAMKWFVRIRLYTWITGLLGSWLFVPLWFLWTTSLLTAIGGCYCGFMYTYAVFRYGKLKYLFITPIYSIIEPISVYWGRKRDTFVVIDKN